MDPQTVFVSLNFQMVFLFTFSFWVQMIFSWEIFVWARKVTLLAGVGGRINFVDMKLFLA